MRARPTWIAAPLLALAALGCQARAQQEASPQAAVTAAADLAGCRADLVEIVATYRDLARDDATRQRADRSKALAASLSLTDMSAYAQACPDIGRWKAAARSTRDAVAADRAARGAAAQAAATGPFPTASYSALCGSTRSNTEAFFAAQLAFQVAKGVWSLASRACEQVAVALGEGGNTSVACVVVDEALYIAEKVLEDIKFCDDDVDSAEIEGSYDRLGYMQDEIVGLDGKLDALDRKLTLVDQKIDALTRAVEQLRLLQCESIRLAHTPEGRRSSDAPACFDQPGFPYSWPFK
jgi:hypothetical protein